MLNLMPLNESNVLEYFALSPFYEKKSINQLCAAQKADFNIKKFQFKGVEFNLEQVSKDKELFLISKNYRKGYNDTYLIAYYYIFKGTIYQSPDIYSIITSNVESITNNLVSIVNEINKV